jgi:hypothetical protein
VARNCAKSKKKLKEDNIAERAKNEPLDGDRL